MSRQKQPGFSPARLLETLPPLHQATRLWVAYSGGCDSLVLLHALASLRPQLALELRAVHVDHGLHPQSAQWADHCRAVCNSLDLPCVSLNVDAAPQTGESPEAAARRARYAALEALMAAGDVICTAHHQDDQAETLLLQLLRGAGPKGMAAMPAAAELGPAQLLRPLLSFGRDELRSYATAQGLAWIEDPSNTDVGPGRNYLRHQVVPVLRQRWPAVDRVLCRSARHCGEAAELLDELAALDLAAAREPGVGGGVLVISRLLELSTARQKNLLRHWLHGLGFSLPSEAKLQHILSDVLLAAPDAAPCVAWPGVAVRRFRGGLYAVREVAAFAADACVPVELDQLAARSIQLPDGSRVEMGTGQGAMKLSLAKLRQAPLSIRFRQGGESIQPAGRSHHRSLKKLFQEADVPPWWRPRQPLLYAADELVAVVNLCISEGWAAEEGEPGVGVVWQP